MNHSRKCGDRFVGRYGKPHESMGRVEWFWEFFLHILLYVVPNSFRTPMPKISHFILLSQKILKISIKHFFKVFVPATGGNLFFDFLKLKIKRNSKIILPIMGKYKNNLTKFLIFFLAIVRWCKRKVSAFKKNYKFLRSLKNWKIHRF